MKQADRPLCGCLQGVLQEDTHGSQGQTGNNGFYGFLLLFWEEGRSEERTGGGSCTGPQMSEAGIHATPRLTVVQFKLNTDIV